MNPSRILSAIGAASLTVTLGACGTLSQDSQSNPNAPLQAWSQYAPDSRVSLRAIVRADQNCPTIRAGSVSRPMTLRAEAGGKEANDRQPFNPRFDVAACEADGTDLRGTVDIGGQEVRLPVREPKRIVVVGDTGCHLKLAANGGSLQDCRNPAEWPWPRVAATGAALQPDVVIHVGDYHYREQCDDPARCTVLRAAGVVASYGWEGWNADFFKPAAPLLQAAPWVFVRGNHENCDRSGEGWMRFLAPQDYAACPQQIYRSESRSRLGSNHTAPAWRVDLGTALSLVVQDTGAHEDWRPAEEVAEDVELLRRDLQALVHTEDGRRFWLLTHKPVWYDLLKSDAPATALQASTRNTLPDDLDLILSGHMHTFRTLGFARDADANHYPGGRPAQLIVGASGTQMEAQDPKSPLFEGKTPGSKEQQQPDRHLHDGAEAGSGILLNRFSFLLLEREEKGWRGRLLDPDGGTITECRLKDGSKRFDCPFPGR